MAIIFFHTTKSSDRISVTRGGFTLIEIIIGMTVFAIGLTGIYALLQTTMSTVRYSQDEIIVSGLLREQLDLVNNMRDTNLKNYTIWDRALITSNGQPTTTTLTGGIYMIENDFTTSGIVFNADGDIIKSPIKLKKIILGDNDSAKWQATQLVLDDHGRYVHTGSTISNTGTMFASYIIISPLGYTGSSNTFIPVKKADMHQGWVIDARVITRNNHSYREYDAKSMITDWQR